MKKFTSFFSIIIITLSCSFYHVPEYIIKEECLVAETKENFSRMSVFLIEKDKTALVNMVSNREVFVVQKNSKVGLLEQDNEKNKVKIKDGPLKGKIVYVSASLVAQLVH